MEEMLKNKVVVVTGGAAGIGENIVKRLAAYGAEVVICDLNVKDGEMKDGCYCVRCDVTSRKSVEEMVAKVILKKGRIDALVNNAGVARPQLLVDYYNGDSAREIDDASFDFLFEVNVKGLMLCSQAVAREQINQGGGVILNVSSESGMEGSAGQSVYAATKGAVNTFTRSWAKELGGKNIRVLGVAPGIMAETPMRSAAYDEALAYTRGCRVDQLSTDYSKTIPLGRECELDELSEVVAFLISDRASYMTGTIVNVSGGKSRG